MLTGRLQAIEATDPRRVPASRTTNGRDFMPSRKHSQEHFSTDSSARKPNLNHDSSATSRLNRQARVLLAFRFPFALISENKIPAEKPEHDRAKDRVIADERRVDGLIQSSRKSEGGVCDDTESSQQPEHKNPAMQ